MESSHRMESAQQLLIVNVALSSLGALTSMSLLKHFIPEFISRKIAGRDLGKKDKPLIPESMGLVSGCCYILVLCMFIVPLGHYWGDEKYEFSKLLCRYLATLSSILLIMLLGFADDMLDLKWRHKIMLPAAATLPIIFTYFTIGGSTTVVVPNIFRDFVGNLLQLGPAVYALYIANYIIFCSNSINIYAGINGLETGQAVVITVACIVHNIIELDGPVPVSHLFSLFLLIPFLFTMLPLFYLNWYPAQVFVGDTFCYSAGVTIGVSAVLCHYSKTAALLFIPQGVNFILSLPQLARIIPCPRHRLPRYDASTNLCHASSVKVDLARLSRLGRLVLWVCRVLRLVRVTPYKGSTDAEVTNLTLLCIALNWFGPMKERSLATLMIFIQVLNVLVAFVIRYKISKLFFY